MDKFELKSQSLKVALLLAIIGGFLDSYSYLIRNQVFANAQTGNMVLLGINLLNHDYFAALHYLFPIISFFIGILLVEYLSYILKNHYFHWRNYTLITEILLLIIVAFLPLSMSNIANVIISFTCAIQVQSFKHFHNMAYASTMCTGNLIKSAKSFSDFQKDNDKSHLVKGFEYLSVIIIFIIGAALAVVLTNIFSYHSIIFCVIIIFAIIFIINN